MQHIEGSRSLSLRPRSRLRHLGQNNGLYPGINIAHFPCGVYLCVCFLMGEECEGNESKGRNEDLSRRVSTKKGPRSALRTIWRNSTIEDLCFCNTFTNIGMLSQTFGALCSLSVPVTMGFPGFVQRRMTFHKVLISPSSREGVVHVNVDVCFS